MRKRSTLGLILKGNCIIYSIEDCHIYQANRNWRHFALAGLMWLFNTVNGFSWHHPYVQLWTTNPHKCPRCTKKPQYWKSKKLSFNSCCITCFHIMAVNVSARIRVTPQTRVFTLKKTIPKTNQGSSNAQKKYILKHTHTRAGRWIRFLTVLSSSCYFLVYELRTTV